MTAKHLFIFFALVFLFGCAGKTKNTKGENDLKKWKLQGKVESVREDNYDPIKKNGEVIKGDIDRFSDNCSLIFSPTGKIVEENYYFQDTALRPDSKVAYKYDGQNRLIEEDAYRPDDKLDFKWVYKINSDKTVAGYDVFDLGGELLGRRKFEYDEKGNTIADLVFENDSSANSKTVYKYDNKNNKIEIDEFTADGTLHNKTNFTYDDKGNKIEEDLYKFDGSLAKRYAYEYYDSGHLIFLNDYKSDGTLSFRNTYKYDERGNLVEYNMYDATGKLFGFASTFKYDYDKAGNFIRIVEYYGDKPQKITEREIKYYE